MAGAFDGILGAVFGNLADRAMPVIDHSIRPWISELTRDAMRKWSPMLMGNIACGVPVSPSSATRCGAPAVRPCLCCGIPTCLHHAMVSQVAEVCCIKCVTDYMKLMRERGQEPVTQQPPWVESNFEQGQHKKQAEPPRHASVQDEERIRDKHLRVLGLDEDADDEDIRFAYRDLVKAWHPDKAQGDLEKQKFHKKFLKIQAAWDYLSKNKVEP